MRSIAFLASAFTLFILSACSPKINFMASSVVPAAKGTVKIKTNSNNNYAISISILHLADPERLQPPRKTYVAWIETEQNNTKNIGQFQSDNGMFSQTLKASLNTVSAFKPTKVFVTAEDDAAISYPTGQTVLTTASLR